MNWNIKLLTLFPEMFPGPLAFSVAGKAIEKGLFSLEAINIRNYAVDKHKTVDDKVFGGGAGLLMRPDVIASAIDAALQNFPQAKLIYFTPRGKLFNHKIAKKLTQTPNIIMLCGRYEGVDQRVFKKYNFEEYSIGDYILSGGEIAALTVIDSCVRFIPGVIDNEDANSEESFMMKGESLLEYDQYTKPSIWESLKVPEVLLSGNHQEIAKWRKQNAMFKTLESRPDLLEKK